MIVFIVLSILIPFVAGVLWALVWWLVNDLAKSKCNNGDKFCAISWATLYLLFLYALHALSLKFR